MCVITRVLCILHLNFIIQDSMFQLIIRITICCIKYKYKYFKSSPNTPGLRDWQKRDHLEKLLKSVIDARNSLDCQHKPALLLKLAPDLNTQEKKDIAQVLSKTEVRIH